MDSNSKKVSTYLKDLDSISTSDVKEIKIDEDFCNRYDLNDFEKEIMAYAVHTNMSMTAYQCENFVAKGAGITPWRQVRQAFMELESRYHSYQEIKTSLRKAELIRKKWMRDQAEATDEIAKEMLQVDIEKNDYDITIWKRKLLQAETEINAFMAFVKKHATTEDDLQFFAEERPEEERKYWIARLAKQAATDVISYGRIGAGNMDSITQMPEEDQMQTIALAMKYSGEIQAGIHNISMSVQPGIDKMIETKNDRIPNLLDTAENIQLTDQPKINGTTVL
jgi:hypothetical protein